MAKRKPYICYRLFTVGQFEQEENWLNKMAAKGMMLTKVNVLRYEFEQAIPGTYQYRLEFLDHLGNNPSSASYLSFLEDSDVEHIGTTGRWIYLRKSTAGGAFELYSDNSSKYQYYRRIHSFCLFFAVFEGFISIGHLHNALTSSTELAPSSLVLAVILILVSLLFGSTALSLHRKMKQIKKDQTIFDA